MPPSLTIDTTTAESDTSYRGESSVDDLVSNLEAGAPSLEAVDRDPTAIARPRWVRPAFLALLIVTAGSYLWNLAASGYGNTFYAAAVEAGSKSWKAMLFGSLDPSNFITVDKPPAALWVMEISARIFGFNTWSVMVPGVLEGVAAVALLYAAVRRFSNPATGLVAGAILAATPVAALMFRFDNPDAFLVLLLVAAAYCMTRAIERAGTKWILAVGALLGFAFLTKMMQAFTVVPAFGLAYLIAAPTNLRRRIWQLLLSLGALALASGWWLAIVSLTPASDRPFIDGSPDNSIWNLIFVYNGFGRLSGSSGGGGGGGGGGGANFSGTAGVFRLFNDLMGGQASWLLPAALLGTVVVLVARRRQPRTDRLRAAVIIWGGWLLVTGAVFSFGKGVIHTYYTVALAPAIAAMVALAGYQLWIARQHLWARVVASLLVASTATWAWALLDRTPTWNSSLRWVVVLAAFGAVGAMLAAPLARHHQRLLAGIVAGGIVISCLGGPVAYAAATIATGHTGSIPSAGPTVAGAQGGGFGGTPGGSGSDAGGGRGGSVPTGVRGSSDTFGAGTKPTGGFPGGTGAKGAQRGTRPTGTGAALGTSGSRAGGMGAGGAGGGTTANSALTKALEDDATHYRWVAAVDGSQSAATLELSTGGDAVMAIGGFNGEGGQLTLAAFEAYVKAGDIHYYIGGSSGGGPGGSNSSSAITSWVEAHYKATTIGGETVYDLSTGAK